LLRLKEELKKIVHSFSSDRIGLIIFSSDAFLQCPLTYDQSALNLFIETLNSNLVPNTGTDFAPPLKLALTKLSNEESSLSRSTSKAIILISDGEDFGGESEKVAGQIKQSGIKLFTLGIGTEGGSRILTSTGYKKDKSGKEVVTKLDARVLKRLAINTDGRYFEISDQQNDTDRLINTISNIEGEIRESRKMDVETNKYMYFLFFALILILIDLLTNVKVLRI
ncbi:vWA domain-containing protein, partial [Xanthovirga aplysinae]|uniref:vWA domain-containing protein n=1 Tax=Xanthovirga aplysinae TaxID=2529853 RepID=UPI0012BB937A